MLTAEVAESAEKNVSFSLLCLRHNNHYNSLRTLRPLRFRLLVILGQHDAD